MSEKNTITLIIVAVIGAIGAILAACIGLIPTVLPMVRPTGTPTMIVAETFTPSNTPLAETASATVAPSDTATLTATLQPLETPTETQTTVPTPASSSSDMDDYEGTWVNVDDEPASQRVQLVVTRIEIAKTGDDTANVAVCRFSKDGEFYILPNPAQAAFYQFALVARDFTIPMLADRKWTILVQQSGDQLVATVQEYDLNNIILQSDTFRLEKINLLESVGLSGCDMPPATASP
jgi:hypothetical protein